MNVVTIGRVDKSIFEEGSAERARIADYGKLFDRLVVIAFFPERAGYASTTIAPNVEVVPTNSLAPFLYPWDAYRLVRKIFSEGGEKDAKWVVSAQDPFESGIVAYVASRRLHVPLHIQVHTDVMSPFFGAESVKNKIRQMLARFVLRRADGIRVVSKRIFRSLVQFSKYLEKKIVVLPILVSTEAYRRTDATNRVRNQWQHFDFIFLMASRLTQEKDIPLAIRAIGRIAQQFPRVGLLIVGDGPEKAGLERLMRKLNLQENIIFINRTEQLADYYHACDAFVITSQYEGYGRTAIESLAAGKPVIMTDVGVADWIVRDHDNGLVIPVGDEGALVEALKVFLSDRVLRHRLHESAREAHGGEMTKAQYDELYKASLESLIV